MKRIIKKIVKRLSTIKEIKAIILYGGFARGEITSRSDIDLFIITSENAETEKMQEKIISLESSINKNIQPTIRTIKQLQKTDTGLLQNIFQEGKILYLKEPLEIPVSLLLKQKPYLIYSFQLSGLGQKDKVRFNRQLYSQKKENYKYDGLLEKIGGKRLSSGCILLPYSARQKIEKFFKKFKIKYESVKVWR